MKNLIYLTVIMSIFAAPFCVTANEESPIQKGSNSKPKLETIIITGKLKQSIKKGKNGKADTVTYSISSKKYGIVTFPPAESDDEYSGFEELINKKVKAICLGTVSEVKRKKKFVVLEFIGFAD